MTMLAEKLEAAGVDTASARLRVMAETALRNRTLNAATDSLLGQVKARPEFMRALVRYYLEHVQADMRGLRDGGHTAIADGQRCSAAEPQLSVGHILAASSQTGGADRETLEPAPAKDVAPTGQSRSASAGSPNRDGGLRGSADKGQSIGAAAREPTAFERVVGAKIARAAALTILDRVRTSDNRAWGDVGAHELHGMKRDGLIAKLISDRLGVLTNEQRFQPLRALIKPTEFAEILQQARQGDSHAA